MEPRRLLLYTALFGAIGLLLVSLRDTTPSQWCQSLVGYCAYPFITISSHITNAIDNVGQYNRSYEDLEKQVQNLSQEVASLQLENHRLAAVTQYHDDIAQLASFAKSLDTSTAPVCQVLLRHLGSDRQFFYVQGGAKHGITEGMVALDGHRLLGRVTQVMPHYCTVTLITDSLSAVTVYCATTKSIGILAGLNKANECALKFVDHLSPISVGDTLVTSGQGLQFPRGFLVGEITSDFIDGVYHVICVKPTCDVRKIRYCVLIDPATIQALPEIPVETKTEEQAPPKPL